MAIAHVQTGKLDNTATSGTIVLTLTAGNTVIVWGRTGNTNAITCSDGVNTYTHLVKNAAAASYPEIDNTAAGAVDAFIAHNVAGGSTTITWSHTGSVTNRVHAMEISGLATSSAQDAAAFSEAVGTTATDGQSSGVTATRSQADEILIGFMFSDGGPTITAGSGFTIPTNGTTSKTAIEYKIVSATGTDAATFTVNVTDVATLVGVITLKASGGGAAVANSNFLMFMGPQPQQ